MGKLDRYLTLRGWTNFDGSWCDWLGDENTGARKVCSASQAFSDQLGRDRFLVDFLREHNLRSESEYDFPRMVCFINGALMFHAVKVVTELTPEHRAVTMKIVGILPDYDFETTKYNGDSVLVQLQNLGSKTKLSFDAMVTDLEVTETVTNVTLTSVDECAEAFE